MNFDLNHKFNTFENNAGIKSSLIIENCKREKYDVSIMIPTYNRPVLLLETLFSAIKQKTSLSYEIVIIDDTPECVINNDIISIINNENNCAIRYFHNDTNIGLFGNWNRCIELARAEWFTILNDDDILADSWLDDMMALKDNNSFVGCRCKRFTDIKEISSYFQSGYFRKEKVRHKIVPIEHLFFGMWTNGTLGTLLNKKIALDIGGFDEKLYPMSDWHFYFKYANVKKLKIINENLVFNRWLENESMKLDVVKGQIKTNLEFRTFLLRSDLLRLSPIKYISYRFIGHVIMAKAMRIAEKEYSTFSFSKESKRIGFSSLYLRVISFFPYGKIKKIMNIL
ncbi:glycosyltransferase family 2 protein [Photobacterium sp. GB-72]|uniref:glycosyltransferase family 2 protein n=1 Tax=Photobacterium sp. GB-72 TaxID=2022105 RepID=UPI000D17BCB5|nr:glycosyltransferase family 2 protein [Photobacterium sp. GB-72]PSV32327.1 hypothetical protein C9J40_03895 [Photobacterium sp. GB-72]